VSTAVVFIGGAPPHPGVVAHLPKDRWVIAADSGYDHAIALGVHVDEVVGDLDSVSAEGLARIERNGTPVDRYPTEKAHTDTEVALQTALRRGVDRIVVVSCIGDRVDHSFAALVSLADPSLADVTVEAWWGPAHVDVVLGPCSRAIDGTEGETVSVLPVGGPASGVYLSGVYYPLDNAVLRPTASLGVSNVFTQPPMQVRIDTGALLIIRPEAL